MGSARRPWGMAAVAACAVLVGAACAAAPPAGPEASPAAATAAATGSEGQGQANAAPPTVLELLEDDGRFTVLLELLGSGGPLARTTWDSTLFAPTDEAFATLPDDELAVLRSDPQAATDLLRVHMTGGRQRPEEMGEWLRSGLARGAATQSVPFSVRRAGYGYELVWGGATVVEANLEASNGLVHVLDGVASLEP